MPSTKHHHRSPLSSEEEEEDKPCRACSDFKSWAKLQSKMPTNPGPTSNAGVSTSGIPLQPRKDCPLDKDDLGRSSWGLLHSMAAYFPEKPTAVQSKDMMTFFNIFARHYPCEPCRLDFQDDIEKNPPKTRSREELAKWLCDRHNTVNKKLGKPIFDCTKLQERWRDGWLDGSCD